MLHLTPEQEITQSLRNVLEDWNTGFSNVELSRLLIKLAVEVADEGGCLDVANTDEEVNEQLQWALTKSLNRDWQ